MSTDTDTENRTGEDLWVAAAAARHLTHHGVAGDYRAAMAVLHERAAWVRSNVVDAESVRRIVREFEQNAEASL